MSKAEIIEAMHQMGLIVTEELGDAIPEIPTENTNVLWSRRYGCNT